MSPVPFLLTLSPLSLCSKSSSVNFSSFQLLVSHKSTLSALTPLYTHISIYTAPRHLKFNVSAVREYFKYVFLSLSIHSNSSLLEAGLGPS